MSMIAIRWQCYPLVAQDQFACRWLQRQAYLQLAANTIDAYGRSLNDYLDFCAQYHVQPQAITREQVALYVHDLASRPHPKGAALRSLESGRGLSNATMQQRITVLRLFCDALVEEQLRQDNPVGRGEYVPGRAFGGVRARALLPRYEKLPWIPTDDEWLQLLLSLKGVLRRTQVMLLLAYEGALRREELVRLDIADFDVALRRIRVCAEHAKSRRERTVNYGTVASDFLTAYLQHRRDLSPTAGPLFLSESHRNRGEPLSLVMWSKSVQAIACQTGLPRFTTHTARHLRLTHLARAHMDLHDIATYAGHRSLQTTMRYIHLSGVECSDAVVRSLEGFERWIAASLGDQLEVSLQGGAP